MTVFTILDHGLTRTDTTFVHTELPYHGRKNFKLGPGKCTHWDVLVQETSHFHILGCPDISGT